MLINVTEPLTTAQLTALHSQVQSGAAALMSAQATLEQLNHPSPDAVQTAQSALDTAQAKLAGGGPAGPAPQPVAC